MADGGDGWLPIAIMDSLESRIFRITGQRGISMLVALSSVSAVFLGIPHPDLVQGVNSLRLTFVFVNLSMISGLTVSTMFGGV